MKTGNTHIDQGYVQSENWPQWSPVMKTGNTRRSRLPSSAPGSPQWSPVMKTGNTLSLQDAGFAERMPQWSPVMKTGNTRRSIPSLLRVRLASMEPGHEDREYLGPRTATRPLEYSLNGARS